MRDWQTRRKAKQERMQSAASMMEGRLVRTERAADLLQALLRPGDRVALEGDNQKQADFLAPSLTRLDPANVHDLHLLISSVSLPEHLDVFEKGICRRIDFSFAGEQSVRMAGLVEDGTVEVGAIHTYVELYARMFVDLIPDVVLLCATQADREGNLFTGPSTEDTPVIAEAAAFHDGVVVVQVDEIVDTLPRVDIPGDWVDVIVSADRPFYLEPLFTRDPRQIGDVEILQAMLTIRGIYERHEVQQLNHGIGFESSTVIEGRLAGFGGAPNMGHDPHGRRHATPAWLHIASILAPAQLPGAQCPRACLFPARRRNSPGVGVSVRLLPPGTCDCVDPAQLPWSVALARLARRYRVAAGDSCSEFKAANLRACLCSS